MAKQSLGAIEEELLQTRARMRSTNWQSEMYSATHRLIDLRPLISTSHGDELHRHVVVASIAALQSFHRLSLLWTIDSGEEYKIRAAELVDEKFSLRDSLTLTGNTNITVGELIVRSAPCNSIQGLISSLSKVLGIDFKAAITIAVEPYARKWPDESALIVKDVDALLEQLHEAFQLRHILAHEAAPDLSISSDKAGSILDAVGVWMEAVNGVLWATAFKDTPLTTYEMNMHARERVAVARKLLAVELSIARRYARQDGNYDKLRQNQKAWKAAAFEWIKMTYWDRQGTMWRPVGANALADILEERANHLSGSNAASGYPG